MKKYLFIAILILLVVIACSKLSFDNKKSDSNKIINLKNDSILINYDSILEKSENYAGLVEVSGELTLSLINSGITFKQYSYYILNNKVDSIYIVANISLANRAKYDTIFTCYTENLLREIGEDPENYTHCSSCGSIQDELNNYEGLWNAFEHDPNLISKVYGNLAPEGWGPCNSIGYFVCCAGCAAAFGEIPPLCIICIWQCACQLCPNPYIGCEYGVF